MNLSFRRWTLGLMMGVVSLALLTGCELLGSLPEELPEGTIELHKTGGFAGVDDTVTIEIQNGSIVKTVHEGPQDNREGQVTRADAADLWQTLVANDAFALPNNTELRDSLADGFQYEVTLGLDDREHRFTVYAPESLQSETGEGRYARIVNAIESLPMGDVFVFFDFQVDDVGFRFLESFPVQVVAEIEGTLPTPCTELREITQTRDGNTVRLHITVKQDIKVSCIQVTEPFETSLKLDGNFPPGDYEVIVNGETFNFST